MNSATQLMKAFGLQKPEFEFGTEWAAFKEGDKKFLKQKFNQEMARMVSPDLYPTLAQRIDDMILAELRSYSFELGGYGPMTDQGERDWLNERIRSRANRRVNEGVWPVSTLDRLGISYDARNGRVMIELIDRPIRRERRTRFA